MGRRLGRIEALTQQGITQTPADAGIGIPETLVARSLPAVAVVVTGRFGDPPTLKLEQPDLPFLRFLEQPRVFYPGVELIVDAVLSPDADPYVDDHVYHGERLFPAVMGLEAMAQAAIALAGGAPAPPFQGGEIYPALGLSQSREDRVPASPVPARTPPRVHTAPAAVTT